MWLGLVRAVCVAALVNVIKWVVDTLSKPPQKPVDLTESAKKLPGKSVEQLIADAKKKLGMDVSSHFNFAVVGQSGVGKSSLINGLRQLRDNVTGSAAVGEVETTKEIQKYPHPTYPHIVLWDVPGAGTLKHDESTYFVDNMLYAFDCILVLSSDRFLKVDFEIAKKAMEFKRQCAFVRTKADISVKAIAERTGKLMRDASKDLRLKVDSSFQQSLRDAGFAAQTFVPMFIVSAWALTRRHAYMLYNYETGMPDTTLDKMDEDHLLIFVTNSVLARIKQETALPP
eukprot:c23358_g1_i2 orf=56-910(-)